MNLPFFERAYVDRLRLDRMVNLDSYNSSEQWMVLHPEATQYVYDSRQVVEPPPVLLTEEVGSSRVEAENAKRIHRWLSNLTPVVAMEERLWVYLTHVTFKDYMRHRWSTEEYENRVSDRYLFKGSSFGALVRNGIARLWWAGFLTYDEKRKDKYELMEVLFSRQDIHLHLLDRSLSKSVRVRTAVLEFLRDNAEWFGSESYGTRVQYLIRDLNLLGGSCLLDTLPDEDLKEQVMLTARRITEE